MYFDVFGRSLRPSLIGWVVGFEYPAVVHSGFWDQHYEVYQRLQDSAKHDADSAHNLTIWVADIERKSKEMTELGSCSLRVL